MSPTSKSLLDKARLNGDSQAWTQLNTVYEPLIRDWLQRLAAPSSDVDDLVQEVLIVVMRKLPAFEHNGRVGAFRNWLRSIAVNCLRDLWKRRRFTPRSDGGSDFLGVLNELEDPSSRMSAAWDKEHDQFVTAAILKQIRKDFEQQSWVAFEMLTLQEKSADEVAEALGTNRGAVYAAKSRIMTRLRREAAGILD